MKFLNDVGLTAGIEDKDGDLGTSGQVLSSTGTKVNWISLGSLAALSSVNNGNWSGTDLSVANGGTGASSASAARTNLGLGSAATSASTDFLSATGSDTMTGTLTINTAAVPFKLIENGHTGTGKYWRIPLDVGNIRFDVDTTNTNGDGTFASYTDVLLLKPNGDVQLSNYGAGILKTDASGNISLDTSTYLTSINNGNWSGTDLSVANGGTGASTASGARTNLGVVNDTGTPAILSNGTTPSLNSGISAAEVRSLIGAGTGSGTSNLVIGTTSTTAMAGNTTTISSAQASAITANTAKVTDTGTPAILSNGTTPSLNSGISAAEVRTLIGAGTSSTTGTTTASNTQTFTNKSGSNLQWTNDAGYITSAGDITAVTAGTNLNGGGTTGDVTLNLDAAIAITSAAIGSTVTLSESADRADLLYINSSTSSWGGLQIGNTSNEFIFSLMGNGNEGGIYDDVHADWIIRWDENAAVKLNYNASEKLATTNTGVSVTGSLTTSSDITVSGGDITLGGTGRIQGVDTVSANTDAANKLYVDTAVAGVPVGDITGVTAGSGISGGGTSGTVTVNVDYAGTDNIILEAQDLSGTQIEDGFKILFSDTSNDVSFGNVNDLPFGSSNLVIGTTSTTAMAGNTTTISSSQASAITTNSAKTGITSAQASAITANTAKVGITSTQASNITTNNAKVSDTGTPAILSNGSTPSLNSGISAAEVRSLIGAGTGSSNLAIGTTSSTAMAGNTTTISSGQASAITANTAKTGITSSQASAITANTAKTGITSSQASAITANSAKTGITSSQASAITANTAKVSDTGTPAILSNGSEPELNTNMSGAQIRDLIGAGTSSLAIGTTASTAKAGNITTITSGQATAITANTAKTGITSSQASAITANTAKVSMVIGSSEEEAMAGDTRTITSAEITAISTNSAKTGITSGQASAITANTAKTGITSSQASAITANTAKVTDSGTPAILSNGTTPSLNSGISAAEVRSLIGAGTSSLAIGTTASTAKAGNTTTITSAQATAITANTAKVSDTGTPAILSNGSTPSLNSGISAAEVRSLIGAGTGSGTTTASNTQTFTNKSGSNNQWTNDAGYITGVDWTEIAGDPANINISGFNNDSGFTANTGTITGVSTGTGLDGTATSGSVTITLDLSELADMTQTMVGTDEFIVLDNGAERRKAANEIGLSIFSNDSGFITGLTWEEITGDQSVVNISGFNNDAGYTSNTGDITAVTAGTGMSGGGTSGAVTLNCTIDSPGEVGLGNLSSSGNALAGSFTATGDITAFSDARVKENIETIPNALDKVSALRGVTYNKLGESKSSMGVVAQELLEVIPEVVHENNDGMYSVAYGNIVAVLIEAMKEQQEQINDLKIKLDGFTK